MRSRIVAVGGTLILLAVAAFVIATYRFPPLHFDGGTTGISGNAGETIAVGWDLENTGWFPARFSEHAIQALASFTKGLPRLINAYCVNCLLDTCAHDQQVVDEANVRRVAAEFDESDRAAAGW
jgi:hypothetical protein